MEFTLSKSFTAVAKSLRKIESRLDECVEHQPEAWAEELAQRFKIDPSFPQPVEHVFYTAAPVSHQVLPIADKGKTRYLVTAVVQVHFEFLFEGDLEDDPAGSPESEAADALKDEVGDEPAVVAD